MSFGQTRNHSQPHIREGKQPQKNRDEPRDKSHQIHPTSSTTSQAVVTGPSVLGPLVDRWVAL